MEALNGNIVRNGKDGFVILLQEYGLSFDLCRDDLSAVFNDNTFFLVADFERIIAVFEPVVRDFDLFVIDDFLFEKAVLVADSVAVTGEGNRPSDVRDRRCPGPDPVPSAEGRHNRY